MGTAAITKGEEGQGAKRSDICCARPPAKLGSGIGELQITGEVAQRGWQIINVAMGAVHQKAQQDVEHCRSACDETWINGCPGGDS